MNLSFLLLFHKTYNVIFYEFKVLKKVITTENFNVDFHDKFIKFWIICFLNFFIQLDLFPWFHIYREREIPYIYRERDSINYNSLFTFFIYSSIWLSIIGKSNLTDKLKRSFFQAAVVSILLYGCTTWTLTKWLETKLDGNYTRLLRAILNKSWQQHPTSHQLYGHLAPITKTIKARRTRHAGHCWRRKDELESDVLLWTPTYGQSKAGRPARTYIQLLCDDTGYNPEDLPEAVNDRETWRERVRDIRAGRTTWWWWWYICHSWY